MNSPYDPVARKRIALRDFSAESRQDTQAIITPTQKRVKQSSSQFKDEAQVKEEARLEPKKPETLYYWLISRPKESNNDSGKEADLTPP